MAEQFGTRSYFEAPDYIVCGGMLLASLAIGLYYGLSGDRQRTSSEYILANRQMSFLPATLSLIASFSSGISVQGIPADVYYHGPMLIWFMLPMTLGAVLSMLFFMPMYYRLGMTSVYTYLDLRFNTVVQICGIISFLLFTLLYLGLITYTACVAVTAVTGISLEAAIVGSCIVCAIYTVIGGIKAVLWTDSLQMILMLAAVIAIIIKGSMELDGFGNVWRIASEGQRTNFFEFDMDFTDFYNGWGFTVGQITYINWTINNQYMVQRFVVCKSEAVARACIVGYIVGEFIFVVLLILAGFTIYAYYEGCDPLTLGYTTKNDQIVPYFVVDVFGHLPAVPGLLLAGLFGAALSTLSSVLNANATLVGEHFVKPIWKEMSDPTYTIVLKMIVVAFAVITLGSAFLVPAIGDAVPVMVTLNGGFHGTLLALYVLGAFVPWCGPKGAVSGYVVGLAVALTMSIGSVIYAPPPQNLQLSGEFCLNDTQLSGTEVTQLVTAWDSNITVSNIENQRSA
ncbi:sodium-coupled monocarboxylate transporter 2-like [Patiria miniata]|uniref:Sodium-coupled monocarboxylate transporter 1 n=1 Tax=Patiria miniata TaxID=46514 RepID=A0A914BMJ0_PATMI|nr:sodium-coupled monocarboxylate transporter 2-like [Patiria miniata]